MKKYKNIMALCQDVRKKINSLDERMTNNLVYDLLNELRELTENKNYDDAKVLYNFIKDEVINSTSDLQFHALLKAEQLNLAVGLDDVAGLEAVANELEEVELVEYYSDTLTIIYLSLGDYYLKLNDLANATRSFDNACGSLADDDKLYRRQLALIKQYGLERSKYCLEYDLIMHGKHMNFEEARKTLALMNKEKIKVDKYTYQDAVERFCECLEYYDTASAINFISQFSECFKDFSLAGVNYQMAKILYDRKDYVEAIKYLDLDYKKVFYEEPFSFNYYYLQNDILYLRCKFLLNELDDHIIAFSYDVSENIINAESLNSNILLELYIVLIRISYTVSDNKYKEFVKYAQLFYKYATNDNLKKEYRSLKKEYDLTVSFENDKVYKFARTLDEEAGTNISKLIKEGRTRDSIEYFGVRDLQVLVTVFDDIHEAIVEVHQDDKARAYDIISDYEKFYKLNINMNANRLLDLYEVKLSLMTEDERFKEALDFILEIENHIKVTYVDNASEMIRFYIIYADVLLASKDYQEEYLKVLKKAYDLCKKKTYLVNYNYKVLLTLKIGQVYKEAGKRSYNKYLSEAVSMYDDRLASDIKDQLDEVNL